MEDDSAVIRDQAGVNAALQDKRAESFRHIHSINAGSGTARGGQIREGPAGGVADSKGTHQVRAVGVEKS